MDQLPDIDPLVHKLLAPDETVHAFAQASDMSLVVTDRRLAVAADGRLALDVPFQGLRRVQFDIERRRPATFVIVPEHLSDEPQVITIPRERYTEVAHAVALIGDRIYGLD
jgi:hypothetical protein